MRIGRDHIASTVTPSPSRPPARRSGVLVDQGQHRPLLDVLLTERFAAEVLSILVGSIGLVLAVPLTTAVGVAVVRASGSARTQGGRLGRLALLTPSASNGRQPSRSTRSRSSRNAAQRKCRRRRRPNCRASASRPHPIRRMVPSRPLRILRSAPAAGVKPTMISATSPTSTSPSRVSSKAPESRGRRAPAFAP